MSGETNLSILLSSLCPVLSAGSWVFCHMEKCDPLILGSCWALVREDEGCTLILEQALASERGLPGGKAMRRLTLTVYSSLEAVGLTAAVSTALAQVGISANVIAGYYHDHIFVPEDRAEEALEVLQRLSKP